MALTDRQELFCREYIIDGNASQAYIRAGYSRNSSNALSSRLLSRPAIRARIRELMEEKESALIARGDEVLKYLTSVLRGETFDEVIDKDGGRHRLKVAERDRIKAAELLGKRYMLFTDRVENTGAMTVIIAGEEELED